MPRMADNPMAEVHPRWWKALLGEYVEANTNW